MVLENKDNFLKIFVAKGFKKGESFRYVKTYAYLKVCARCRKPLEQSNT